MQVSGTEGTYLDVFLLGRNVEAMKEILIPGAMNRWVTLIFAIMIQKQHELLTPFGLLYH
jgi:hypothetical protein